MTREQATALFNRVYKQLSSNVHPFTASLIYTQSPSLLGIRNWHVTIDSWDTHWKIASERDWQEYKRANAVLETDEDLEEYADAARAEAERELEGEE